MQPLVIQGRYEVIRRLAIGGMGEIFLARQTGMAGFRRLVILKTLRPELTEAEGFLDQFLDEARVAATLNHPNIVAIYEVGAWEKVHFIAMEYIGGIDLSALQRETARAHTPIPPRIAAAVIAAAATGLDYAHHARDEAGQPLSIVHRDVSPQNLMIRPDGVVKVVDFGVAQAKNQVHETAADRIKGKVRYMAPEQLAGEALDGRTDQFSLGIVLWELLTGKPLFPQTSPIEIFQRLLAGSVRRPREVAPEVPEALDAIAMRMMSVQRVDRYPRANDVAAALRAYLDASGGAADDELTAFVTSIAGHKVEARIKDLTPQAHTFTSSAVVAWPDAPDDLDANASATAASDAPTRVLRTEPPQAAPIDATVEVARRERAGEDDPLEQSDVFLAAVEGSGVLHGARKLLTVLAGRMPGWGALAARMTDVPMGAFATTRLKNLLVRQLERAAREHGASVLSSGAEGFVLAFGVDEMRPDDAARAVRCAQAVQLLLRDLGGDPHQKLLAHMGIASGVCIVELQDDGAPMQVGGAPVDAADALAARAHADGAALYVTTAVERMVQGHVALRAIDEGTFAVDPPPETTTGPSVADGRKRILIADDADVVRRIIEQILRPFDFSFLHAKDGAQAVKLAVEQKPDLVLLDVQMPIMDGVQVLSFLKKNPATAQIPVVIITTIGRPQDEKLLMDGGAASFLRKPVVPAALVAAVRQLLGVRG